MEDSSTNDYRGRSQAAQIGLAVLMAFAAIALRQLLDPALGDTLPLATLYGGVAVTVWYGGWRPAAVTALAGYTVANYLFIPPRYEFVLKSSAVWIGFSLYAVSCFLIVFMGEAARGANERRQRQVVERIRAEEALRREQERLTVALKAGKMGVYDWNPIEHKGWWSPEVYSLYGVSPETFDIADSVKMAHPEDLPKVMDIPRSIEEHRPWIQEYRIIRPDGQVRWLSSRAETEYDSEGRGARFYGVIWDVTDRKRLEEELRKALAKAEEGERLLTALMEHVPEGITIADAPDVRIRMVSRAGQEITGKPRKVLEGIPAEQHAETWNIYYADGVTPGRSEDLPLTRAVQKGEAVIGEEWVLRGPGGRRIPVLCNAAPIRDAAGNIVSGIIAWRDISERKETEERFRLAVEATPNGMVLTNEQGDILLVNSSAEKLFGYSRGEMVGKSIEMLLPDRFRAAHLGFREMFKAAPRPRPMGAGRDLYGLHKNGTEFPIEVGLNPIKTGDTTVVLSAIVDISSRKEAEATNLLLKSVVESSLDGIISTDLSGRITSWNRGAEKMFGYSDGEVVGRTFAVIIPPGQENEVPSILARIEKGEGIEHYETVRRTKSGRLISISATWSPILDARGRITGASKIVRDITEQKQIEAQRSELLAKERALASEKALREKESELARILRGLSLGELATSIAHEVNQPLAALVANAHAGIRWLSATTPNLAEVKQSLDLVVRDGNRASTVIQRIRGFLRKERASKRSLVINEIIGEAVALANMELVKRHISVRMELCSDLPPVEGDRIQLQQVILNLLMNAADAMASSPVKEVLLESRRHGAGEIIVSVQDSGAGMRTDDLEKMFEPFFSTKPSGMGMGLSISRSIIEAHGGRIWATSNDGPGLTVQFTLASESDSPKASGGDLI